MFFEPLINDLLALNCFIEPPRKRLIRTPHNCITLQTKGEPLQDLTKEYNNNNNNNISKKVDYSDDR